MMSLFYWAYTMLSKVPRYRGDLAHAVDTRPTSLMWSAAWNRGYLGPSVVHSTSLTGVACKLFLDKMYLNHAHGPCRLGHLVGEQQNSFRVSVVAWSLSTIKHMAPICLLTFLRLRMPGAVCYFSTPWSQLVVTKRRSIGSLHYLGSVKSLCSRA